jgi:phosphatidylglycerol---prolipoprotein diacylglyceryl transferase
MNWQKYLWWFLGVVVSVLLLFVVFPGKIILPQSFTVGSLQIHYYGLIIALAVLASWRYLQNKRSEVNITTSQLENLVIVILICGFIVSRIYHVFTDLDFYLENPLRILHVWNGGLAIFGSVIGGLIGVYFYNRLYLETNFLKLLDYLVPGLVIGQIIGRFGNLINYELYGQPTSLPWKMFVPQIFQTSDYYIAQSYFHPLFLYESLAGLLILWVLLRYNELAKRFGLPNKAGSKFWVWLILYGILRFGIELLRIDGSYVLGLRLNLIVSSIMVIIGLYFLLFKKQYESTSSQNN